MSALPQSNLLDQMQAALAPLSAVRQVGRVTAVQGARLQVAGDDRQIRIGDRARLGRTGPLPGAKATTAEVVGLGAGTVTVICDGPTDGIALGDRIVFQPPAPFAPDASWIGRVIDPDGQPLDGRPLLPGTGAVGVDATPPAPHLRRQMGPRMDTGLALFNTLLPVAQGQRLGLFAGSGVGKSSLLADFAKRVRADVIVIALVGERGRELRHFVDHVLGPDGMARAVVVAATSDRSAQLRRRCALSATAVAEYFRDQGQQVLLLIDSITRFCEAHREVAVAAGEPANLRGFPASTAGALASLCERAGTGAGEAGDITALFSVLVAGSDMEEPVADMLRGILDGHIVLSRDISERGRFPAVDVVRSVSRSLPDIASPQENALITQARQHLGAYAKSELMIQSGLYVPGSDPGVDAAIGCADALEAFMTIKDDRGVMAHFAKLRQALTGDAKLTQGQS